MTRLTRALAAAVLALTVLVAPATPADAGTARFTSLAPQPIEDDGALPVLFTLVDQQYAVPYYNPQGVTISGHAAATYACVYSTGYALRTETITDSFVQADYYFPFDPAVGTITGELEAYPPPSWMTCKDGTTLKLKSVTYFGMTAGFGLQRVGMVSIPGTFTRSF